MPENNETKRGGVFNQLLRANTRQDVTNGRPSPTAAPGETAKAAVIMPFGDGQFTPPLELPRVAALLPQKALNPDLLPVKPVSEGLEGLSSYLASQGSLGRDATTLFHAPPPTDVRFPRPEDSQNLPAVPPRFLGSQIFKIFSKPRRGTPGSNPGGVNTTKTS